MCVNWPDGAAPKVIEDIACDIFGSKASLVLTNVVGPRETIRLAGVPVDRLMFCVPHPGDRIGMGASLGALAMLHAHLRHPGTFDGLLLQSGSFFRQRFDKHESSFGRYRRVTRFVGTVLRDAGEPIPVALTCGTAEENRANNLVVAESLAAQGYPAWYADIRDAHNWACWRDAFDPHLRHLLKRAWLR